MKSNAKELVLRLLGKYEQVYAENAVLKAMLASCADPRISQTWEKTLHQIIVDRTSADALHATFDELRAQVEQAIDAEVAFQVLLKLPAIGKPN